MKIIFFQFALLVIFSALLFAQIPPDRSDLLNGNEGNNGYIAEVNGYPSPKIVLSLASTLKLTSSQKSKITDIYNDATARARQLGKEIVQIENELYQAFQARIINQKSAADDAQQIGRLRGKLRGVFLTARIKTRNVLDESQIEMYKKLQGDIKKK